MEEELLSPDVIEHHILERLDVKTLLKFKSVSKQWKSTIESTCFHVRQLIHRRQSGDPPDVLFVSLYDPDVAHPEFEPMRTLVVGSSVSAKISTPWDKDNKLYEVCNNSCDGLICIYELYDQPSVVFNPTTRWHRTFPPCNYQQVDLKRSERLKVRQVPYPSPGFGKDKFTGTYKPVWLYNSAELGLNDKATTCEVFDFATNAWRYLVSASPYLILHIQAPVYLDGSLHWFTASSNHGQTKVLSLDLHTETFQVISTAPFLHAAPLEIFMCNLDDRLCVSEKRWPNQVIWSFDSDHKTWKTICSIDLNITSSWFGNNHRFALSLLAVVDKDDKLLFYDREYGDAFVTHDPKTKSYDLAYTSKLWASVVCYFPSLVSIL